jgi:hypothetical protein
MSASTGALEIPRRRPPRAWLAVGAIVVVTTIGVAALFATAGSEGLGTDGRAVPDATAGSELTLIEQLVNEGLLPRETLEVKGERTYSAQDRALIAAVASGQVPDEVLESDYFLIRRLVNQGLIPSETIGR